MSKIRIAALVFMLGFAISSIIALGIQMYWQWFLVIPAALLLFYLFRHVSGAQHHDTDLIGIKGGRSLRRGGFDEYDDEE